MENYIYKKIGDNYYDEDGKLVYEIGQINNDVYIKSLDGEIKLFKNIKKIYDLHVIDGCLLAIIKTYSNTLNCNGLINVTTGEMIIPCEYQIIKYENTLYGVHDGNETKLLSYENGYLENKLECLSGQNIRTLNVINNIVTFSVILNDGNKKHYEVDLNAQKKMLR